MAAAAQQQQQWMFEIVSEIRRHSESKDQSIEKLFEFTSTAFDYKEKNEERMGGDRESS